MLWNNRRNLIALMAATRAPALYPEREYADDSGLMTCGPNDPDIFRRAGGHVDRILKGAKPGDLPSQYPAKSDSVVNLTTAHALGLAPPSTFVAHADEPIEAAGPQKSPSRLSERVTGRPSCAILPGIRWMARQSSLLPLLREPGVSAG